ncbi:MAG: hypothetical protein WA705_19590 [Candidatus Ozemobacteraceae bacterium]
MSRQRLDSFFTTFLQTRGAVIEPVLDGLRGLLEPDLAQRLGTTEDAVFSFQADRPGIFVGMGSELLEAATAESLATIPVGFGRFDGVSLRGKNLDEDLHRDFTFLRCSPSRIDSISSCEPVTRVWYRLSMVSDEVRELLLPFSCLESSRRLLDPDEEPPTAWDLFPLPSDDVDVTRFLPLEILLGELEPTVRAQATAEVTRFQAVQKHRLGLDLQRVTDYFSGLCEGLEERHRGGLAASAAEAKKQALLSDFHRQVEDVRRKASIKVTMRPVAVLRLLMPVLAAKVEMKVGKNRREFRVIWSPLRRRFEPFSCPVCGLLGHRLEGTRDGDLVCPTCAAKN